MTDRAVGVEDVASAAGVADYRVRERTVSGSTMGEQYLIYEAERVDSFKGMATTFRIPGVTGTGQNWFSIFNAAASPVLVAIRELTIVGDYTTNSVTMRFFATSRVTTAPTGGTALGKIAFDSSQTSSASVALLGGASADGTASAITATAGTFAWRSHHMHFDAATDLQQVRMVGVDALPPLTANDPPYLRASEGLLVSLPDASSTSASWVVSCCFEEFTLP